MTKARDLANIISGGFDATDIPNLDTAKITTGTFANARISSSSVSQHVTGEVRPTVTSCTPSTISNLATNVVIAGTNFVSVPQVEALNPTTGIWYLANSITYTSATSITANFTLAVDASYKILVTNPDTGNSGISGSTVLTVSDAPTWTTAAGSLGTFAGNSSNATIATLAGSSDSTVSFTETTSVLTSATEANCSLNSSTGVISTTDFGGADTAATTFNFTVRLQDAEGQFVDRAFSLNSSYSIEGSGGFN